MRICVCTICVSQGPISADYASRFVATWLEFPPGVDCDVLVICNGGPLPTGLALIFAPLKAKMFPRENDGGWDISAYLAAAKGPCSGYDMMVCLGESVYFWKEGWLKRLVEAWKRNGPGMYGPFSSNAVRAHLNTTAFACPPMLLKQYSECVFDRWTRYAFEHGPKCLWRRADQRGMPVRLVTWDGEYMPRLWRLPKNILWRGDQSNLLMMCNHSDGYANADDKTKASWAVRADAPMR